MPLKLATTIEIASDSAQEFEAEQRVSFRRAGGMLAAYADGRVIGRVPPRFNRFLAAEKDAVAKVDSVKGDVVSVGVYLQGRASIMGRNGELVLKDRRIAFHPSEGTGSIVKDVAGVRASVVTGEELRSRVTVTRMALAGIFAFALKKQAGGERFLVVEGPDFAWAVEVDLNQANEAILLATAINDEARSAAPAAQAGPAHFAQPAAAGGSDIIGQLERLASLKAAGALTDEEFSAAKRLILGL